MKIAVTGATGFIGSHLVDALVCRGHDVTCLARSPEKARGLAHLSVRVVYGSMDSAQSLASLVDRQDAVIHAAGLTKAQTPEEYIRVNVGGTENLLSALAGADGRLRHFVYFSSAETMGPSNNGRSLTEAEAFRPYSAYGKSKVMAEERLVGLSQRIPVTIVRPPAVYGPRDRDFAILFRMISRGIFPIVSPSPAFSVVYVKNLVAGICQAIERPQGIGLRSYFFTDGPAISWQDFGETVARALGRRPLRLNVPLAVVRAIGALMGVLSSITGKTSILSRDKIHEMTGSWVFSDQRARQELDYQPAFSTEQGIAETAAWYRNEGWL